jgi:hypothetical protein
VASIVVSRWEGQFDTEQARKILDTPEDELEILTEEEAEATTARA